MTAMDRILVQIASYRDPECQWTIRDLFAKARHPERVTVGVVWQIVAGEDDACFTIETRPQQVRQLVFSAAESRGVCWARHHGGRLWRGEEYLLQIDSHMRLEPDWDVRLLAMLERCPSARPILTHYPLSYTPPDDRQYGPPQKLIADKFTDHDILVFKSTLLRPDHISRLEPEPSAFCAAGFMFSSSLALLEVPYDPHIYFHGEEVTRAARLWTHGWDMFTPCETLAFHCYHTDATRPRHWDDHREWTDLDQLAVRRVQHLLGTRPADDPAALVDLAAYGLGQVRSLAEYQRFAGIDFAAKRIDDKARAGLFGPDAPAACQVAVADEIDLALDESISVQIETINYCNRHCDYCFHGHWTADPRQVMPMALYQRLLDEVTALPSRIRTVTHSAYAEPTIDPLFLDRLELLKARGLLYWNITNGTNLTPAILGYMLANPDLIGRFFLIDVPTLDPVKYRRLAGGPSAQMEHLRDGLHRLGPHIRPLGLTAILTVLGALDDDHRANHAALDAEFADYGFTVQLTPLSDRGGELRPFVDNHIELARVTGCSDRRVQGHLHFGVRGNLYLCCHDFSQRYSYGEAARMPLAKLLGSPRRRQMTLAMQAQMCRRCVSALGS